MTDFDRLRDEVRDAVFRDPTIQGVVQAAQEYRALDRLLALATDPKAIAARLAELQAAEQAAATRKEDADAAHAQLAAERERLAKLEESIREREVALFHSERRHESELEEMRKWRRDHASRRLIHHPGGLTQERDDTETAPDPIADPYGETMELDPIAAVQTQHSGRSLRRGA